MERSQKKKNQRKSFFLRIAQKPLFSPLLSLSVSFFDRRGDVPMRGSDRHQSAKIKNKRALLRVLSSFLRGSVIGHVFNSRHPRVHRAEFSKNWREKRYGIKNFRILFADIRARARILESIEKNKTRQKQQRSVTITYLDLGGLEAGDGRDLLSSSKHYCLFIVFVDVFVCVNEEFLRFDFFFLFRFFLCLGF